MDAIKMTGIVKCFGPVRANDGINFTVKEQEIHCLLGENGTGKSTLMNILFGLYHPDEGEIYIHGQKANIANPNDAYALGIGMVHQHFMLVNQLTVLENIIIGKELGGLFLDKKKSRQAVEELVERFGFKIDLDAKVEELSVGMPLRYNYDKPEKSRISRVFGYLARFFILFQTEKSSREVVIS